MAKPKLKKLNTRDGLLVDSAFVVWQLANLLNKLANDLEETRGDLQDWSEAVTCFRNHTGGAMKVLGQFERDMPEHLVKWVHELQLEYMARNNITPPVMVTDPPGQLQ